MKVLIINGSPAGDDSITLQTMLYIKEWFRRHDYEIINAAQSIKRYENDFSQVRRALKDADLLVFCYPVYTFLVPSQLHRFIELIKESGIDLSDKYATQVSTSKHFYDMTAHEFIRQNCMDLKLKYITGLSADMEDLLSGRGRREALSFFHHVLWSINEGLYDMPVRIRRRRKYRQLEGIEDAEKYRDHEKSGEKKVAIVTDLTDDNPALKDMIDLFRRRFPYDTKVINLRDVKIRGGCLGCFNCAAEGKCIYRDDFERLLRRVIQVADATVYAFSIKDHSMGSLFKMYDDRQFCNGHRTVTMGKPVGYIVDGFLSDEPNLLTVMEARAQVGGNQLAFIAGNEVNTEDNINRLAMELEYDLRHHYSQPADFYGVGGRKIFRDLIFEMQGLMREDHRFYKKNGFYDDFPQNHRGRIIGMYFVGAMLKNQTIKDKIGGSLSKGMLAPYKRAIKQQDKHKPGRKTDR
ncbi:MAG: NAD(P)H-dependent oxidoreductase [Lachnospiraceae bacterium]|nr:NAD(P)H-dependent oxidoreductase [Lachnospiraceae bacterium]